MRQLLLLSWRVQLNIGRPQIELGRSLKKNLPPRSESVIRCRRVSRFTTVSGVLNEMPWMVPSSETVLPSELDAAIQRNLVALEDTDNT